MNQRQVKTAAAECPGRRVYFRCLAVMVLLIAGTVGYPRESAAATPDLSGVWVPLNPRPMLRTLQGATPPLLPSAKAIYEHNIAARKAGDTSFDTTKTMCHPPGMPRVFSFTPFRIVQTPKVMLFLFEFNRLQLPVPIGAKHEETSDDLYFLGEAVGNWAGEEFVLDTIRHTASTLLDEALPHSEAAHIVSRFRLSPDGQRLFIDVSFDDPETFAAPWDTRLVFRKAPPETELVEDVCADREVIPVNKYAD